MATNEIAALVADIERNRVAYAAMCEELNDLYRVTYARLYNYQEPQMSC